MDLMHSYALTIACHFLASRTLRNQMPIIDKSHLAVNLNIDLAKHMPIRMPL